MTAALLPSPARLSRRAFSQLGDDEYSRDYSEGGTNQ